MEWTEKITEYFINDEGHLKSSYEEFFRFIHDLNIPSFAKNILLKEWNSNFITSGANRVPEMVHYNRIIVRMIESYFNQLKDIEATSLLNVNNDIAMKHKVSYREQIIRKMNADLGNNPNSTIKMSTILGEQFAAKDEISFILQMINAMYLKNMEMGELGPLVWNSTKNIKQDIENFSRLFPFWFITAYPDVAVWVLLCDGFTLLPNELREKVSTRLSKYPYDEMAEWIANINSQSSTPFEKPPKLGYPSKYDLTFEDLREIVNLYKCNYTFECAGEK